MRRSLIALSILLLTATAAPAQVSIGINLPVYPQLVRVPNYPVYYAPGVDSNFFFYDGSYWVYQDDSWYASTWYNGPWRWVEPDNVPLFVLRIPVRYYRAPPRYFLGWRPDAAPRWNDHWGEGWARQHPGWDHWNRQAAPPPAPRPAYQRQYSGEHYPPPELQRELHERQYHYQPREALRPPALPPQRPQERTDKAPHDGLSRPRAAEVRAPAQRPAPREQTVPQPHAPEAPRAQAPGRDREREEGGDKRGQDRHR